MPLFACATIVCLGWIGLGVSSVELTPAVLTVAAGSAIVGAAFMFAWFAELVQIDIPRGLAIAFVALVVVLPEYAIGSYYAWMGGELPRYVQYAAANVTGANRLLIGVGWTAVLLFYGIKSKNAHVLIGVRRRVEMMALFLATAYAFVIPLKGTLTLVDTAAMVLIFVWYVRAASVVGAEKPVFDEGSADASVRASAGARRLAALAIFAVAGWAVWTASKPFAEGLLETARLFGVDRFIAVRWMAPMVSESPEFIIAGLFAWRLKPDIGLGVLISSKLSQWTLMVGMLPLVLCISSGSVRPMELDARQVAEVFLTAAQSLFAIVVIMDLRFSRRAAVVVFAMFVTEVFMPGTAARYGYGIVYLVFTAVMLAKSRVLCSGMRHTMRLLWTMPRQDMPDIPHDRRNDIN